MRQTVKNYFPGRSLSEGLLFLAAPTIWAMHFFVLYGAQTWICAVSSRPDFLFSVVTVAATLAALLGLVVILKPQLGLHRVASEPRETPVFLRLLYVGLAGLAALGIVWAAFPASLLTACH